jgi:hypothetical protein
VQEVEQLRRLDPTNPQCELLHRQVMGAIASASSVSQPTDQGTTDHPESKRFKSSVTIDDSPVALVDYESAALAVDPDRLHDFVSLVQPILVNRCGACHSHTSDQEWQLVTPARGVRTSARMARENYAATIRYIDFSAPESSVLLRYALTAHGGGEPGLGPRNALAAETLKRWMQSVTDHQSQASSFATETISSSPLPPLEPAAKEIAESVFPVDTKALKPVGEVSGSKNGLQRLPQVDNPFDPELFNRTFHSDAVSRRP